MFRVVAGKKDPVTTKGCSTRFRGKVCFKKVGLLNVAKRLSRIQVKK